MHIKALQKEVAKDAHKRGWDKLHTFGDSIALMHSELSEALEEFRSNHPLTEIYYSEKGKPEGIPIELADVIIRILHFAEQNGIDMTEALKIKKEFNKTRPYRHGGKKI